MTGGESAKMSTGSDAPGPDVSGSAAARVGSHRVVGSVGSPPLCPTRDWCRPHSLWQQYRARTTPNRGTYHGTRDHPHCSHRAKVGRTSRCGDPDGAKLARMTTSAAPCIRTRHRAATTHVDVLVVGAGISGIGAAWHLRDKCPDHSFAVLEGADDVRRHLAHPHAIRARSSDSDLHTFGYEFKPWTGQSDRAAPAHPRLSRRGHRRERSRRSTSATTTGSRPRVWSSADRDGGRSRARHGETDEPFTLHRRASSTCARATTATARGTSPRGRAWSDSRGEIVHPQTWPDDIDYAGKRDRRDRIGCHRRHADPGPRTTTPSTSPCSSVRPRSSGRTAT